MGTSIPIYAIAYLTASRPCSAGDLKGRIFSGIPCVEGDLASKFLMEIAAVIIPLTEVTSTRHAPPYSLGTIYIEADA